MTSLTDTDITHDQSLRLRAKAVIPGAGGMYGHMSAAMLPAEFPQFFERSAGSRAWDVDGREYIDLMCSWGPIILGHGHAKVDEAALAQLRLGDTQNGPSARMVELAELLVDRVSHADWALFAKNGTDVTTTCVSIARAATGRAKILAAKGAYHGSAPWCTPSPGGVTAADRANMAYFDWNDLASVERAAAEAGGDLAGVVVSPFKHDAGHDQAPADPAFARGLRQLCDRLGAVLILDDVRAGWRLNHGGSWEPLGVEPDLSAWGKGTANGYPIAAVLGSEALRDTVPKIFVTGSFWYSAVPMAAAIATIHALKDEDAVARMEARGEQLRTGLADQAETWNLTVRQTGPVVMPYLTFADDADYAKAYVFAGAVATGGAYLHPRHNWFLSAAHTEEDIAAVLVATNAGFEAVRRRFGED